MEPDASIAPGTTAAPDPKARRRHRRLRIASRIAAGAALVYLLGTFLPIYPTYPPGRFDASAFLMFHESFAQSADFGQDIIFTFGPWGFLWTGYHPDTYVPSLLAWAFITVLYWMAMLRIGSHVKNPWLRGAWWLASLSIVGVALSPGVADVRLLSLTAMLLMLHFFEEQPEPDRPIPGARWWRWLPLGIAAGLGLAGLIKFTFFIAAVPVLGVISVDDVLRRRRVPGTLIAWIVGTIVFWLLAGQPLASYPHYMSNSLRIAAGYTDAAGTWRSLGVHPLLFCAVAGLLVWILVRQGWRIWRWRGLLPAAGLGAVLFLAFKDGYVRHDFHHEMIATATFAVIALIVAASLAPWLHGRQFVRAVLIGIIAVAFGFCGWSWSYYHVGGPLDIQMQTLARVGQAGELVVRLMKDPNLLERQYERSLAQFRESFPVPQTVGTVDVYPWDQLAVRVHGLPHNPRPIIQGMPYNPPLAELNAKHLQGANAPDSILFNIETMDERFPAMDDPPSWPELLTRYDLVDASGLFLSLRRSTQPRTFELKPFKELSVKFDERVELPGIEDGPIWAAFDLKITTENRVAQFFFKAPRLMIEFEMDGGRKRRMKLIPAITQGGFLLSPVIEDRISFATLASQTFREDLSFAALRSMTLRVETASAERYFESPVKIQLFRLQMPVQDLSAVPGMLDARSLLNLNAGIIYAKQEPKFVQGPNRGPVLLVATPTQLALPVSKSAIRLKVGFGLAGPESAPVDFRVFAMRPNEEQPELLWSRVLDFARPDDRGMQHALIERELPAGTNRLLLEARGASEAASTGFWSTAVIE